MKVAVALVAPAVLAAALSLWASSVVGRTPPPPPIPPGAVQWGGLWLNQEGLAAWLNSRGATYRVWAERHPKAAAHQRAAARRERRARANSPNG